jgi:hypothetical protein
MGTNYYISCKCCGSRLKHVGKMSVGRPFLSNYATPEEVIGELEELNRNGEKYDLRNEYDEVIAPSELIAWCNMRTDSKGKNMGWEQVDRPFSDWS